MVLERAHELGDTDMVTALRSEMLWWGNEQGFADAGETIEATERVLAEIGEATERSNAKRALALRTLEQSFEPVAQFALSSGWSRARLAAAYAMHDAKQAVKQTD